MSNCSEEKTVVSKTAGNVVKGIPTRFVRMTMFVSQTIPKRCSRGVSELHYGSVSLRRNWTGQSEGSAREGIDVGGWEMVVPLDPYSVVGLAIYKRSFTSESVALLQNTEAHFDSAKRASSFEEEATKAEVVGEVSRNNVLIARLR